MAKYKILVIQHLLKNNVVAKCGDVVDETELRINIYELEAQGFIEKFEEESNDDSFDLDSFTKAQLIQFAKDNGFEFDEVAKKSDLLESITQQIEAGK